VTTPDQSTAESPLRTKDTIALVCFFLSGAAGLIYEVCWIRRASLVFGSTTFAVSSVLAVFFLGLAAGSFIFGRVAARTARPLRLYGMLEIGLGVAAVLSLPAFHFSELIYGHVYRAFAHDTAVLFAVRIAMVSLILVPPTILMGGTLPLFCRRYVRNRLRVAGSVGLLYAINTFGAATGCALAGLVLLPFIGLQHTLWIGVGLSLLAGTIVWSTETTPLQRERRPDSLTRRRSPQNRKLIFVLFFFVGFAALANEVLWTRYLSLLIRNTVYTYTLTLTVVLVGIVLGSAIASRLFDRVSSRALVFGILQVATGLSMLSLMMISPNVWRSLPNDLWVYFVALLVPAIFSGASFPLAVRMVVDGPSDTSRGVGSMLAVNTLGGILGALLVGFIGLPIIGLESCILIVTGVSLVTGIIAWIRLPRQASRVLRVSVIALSVVIWVGIPMMAGTRVPADFLADRDALVDFREGYGSHLAVVQNDDVLQLEIDRWWQGSNRKNHQVMAAHVPMILHPDPKRALVVGVGSGQTPARFLMYNIDQLHCVDIEPTIFQFIRGHFDTEWMDDDRVSLIREDGRNFINHTNETYDVISLEVGQIFRPGVAFFYTTDFYHIARQRLEPGGYLAQFVPMPFFTSEQFTSVIASFVEVFPQSVLWYNTSELLIIGKNGDRFDVRGDLVERLTPHALVNADLEYSYWGGTNHWLNRPEVFFAGFLAGPAGLAAIAGTGRVYRDDRPVLDYETTDVDETLGLEVAILGELREHIEPIEVVTGIDVPAKWLRSAEEIREMNLGDIVASSIIRQAQTLAAAGDYDRIVSMLSAALEENREHAVTNRMLADALFYERRFEEARSFYLTTIRIRPEDGRARHGLALSYHQMGRLDNAIVHYGLAAQLRPGDAEVHNNFGAALAQAGRLDEALAQFEAATQLRPGFTSAEANVARVRAALRGAPRQQE